MQRIARQDRIDGGSQVAARSYAADIDFAVPNAADHVKVDHGHSFVQGQRGVIHVEARTQKSQFLACEGDEQDSALLLGLGGEPARQLDHAGSA